MTSLIRLSFLFANPTMASDLVSKSLSSTLFHKAFLMSVLSVSIRFPIPKVAQFLIEEFLSFVKSIRTLNAFEFSIPESAEIKACLTSMFCSFLNSINLEI